MAEDNLLDGVHAYRSGMFFPQGDPRIPGWVREAISEGERIYKDDPQYNKMDMLQDYVLGQQLENNRPSYLPNVIVNQTKKSIRTHVAALTDIRPLFAFKTFNPHFEPQGELLNKYTVAWWINTFADLALADAARYALTIGSGDIVVEFDPHFMGGETKLIARDPRDTLPIRPSRERSLQNWEGLIIREAHTPNKLVGMYPEYQQILPKQANSRFGQIFTKFRRVAQMLTPTSTLDGLNKGAQKLGSIPEIVLYRVYINDRSRNLTGSPVLMGKPGTNWAYMAQPGEPLYPNKRLIVCTEQTVLYDGPNQYWHGMYPVSRLQTDPWPWQLLGLGLTADLLPMQNALNTTVNDFLSVFSQAVNRGMVADKNAVPEPLWKRLDPRKPNWKVKLNPTMGEGFKLMDAPNLPPWSMEFLNLLFQKFDEHSETANLNQLMQLRQMPSGDTIEKYENALTPGLRLEGRQLEATLRDVAEMIKVNTFQYQSMAKRVLILGDAGKTLADFDYDPGSLIPAMAANDPGYTPELDKNRSLIERAKFFHKLFAFYVSPNSILAMHAQEKRLEYIQLSRQGYLDFWTLMEMLEIPNVGRPMPIPLPPVDWEPQMDPLTNAPTAPPLVMRVPITITERLMAQQQLGIGQTTSPAGRKASGQAPPQIQQQPDGSTTITES